MTELYSVRDVAKLFAVQESRLRYWMQTGFVGPTVRKGGRFYYTFRDLCAVKAAKDLLAAGLSAQKVRKNLEALRRTLPGDVHPALRMRICSDGESLVALADDVAFVPATGQVVMAFNLPSLGGQIAELLPASRNEPAVPQAGRGRRHRGQPRAHRVHLLRRGLRRRGSRRSRRGRRALHPRPRRRPPARRRHDQPGQPAPPPRRHRRRPRHVRARPRCTTRRRPRPATTSATCSRIWASTDLAIAELSRVTQAAPDFADAHYNLGLALVRVGGTAQARRHLQRYLELDAASEWASRAREYLSQIAA